MENDIADYLSKRAAFKLPVEPGTFLLRLTQPSVEPSTEQNKRSKSGPAKYFPAEPPGAAGKVVAVDSEPAKERPTPAGRRGGRRGPVPAHPVRGGGRGRGRVAGAGAGAWVSVVEGAGAEAEASVVPVSATAATTAAEAATRRGWEMFLIDLLLLLGARSPCGSAY